MKLGHIKEVTEAHREGRLGWSKAPSRFIVIRIPSKTKRPMITHAHVHMYSYIKVRCRGSANTVSQPTARILGPMKKPLRALATRASGDFLVHQEGQCRLHAASSAAVLTGRCSRRLSLESRRVTFGLPFTVMRPRLYDDYCVQGPRHESLRDDPAVLRIL